MFSGRTRQTARKAMGGLAPRQLLPRPIEPQAPAPVMDPKAEADKAKKLEEEQEQRVKELEKALAEFVAEDKKLRARRKEAYLLMKENFEKNDTSV